MAQSRIPPDPHEGVEPPNHTQVPNAIFDLMPLMSEAELKVTLVICRQTFGWHKKEDELSLSQLKTMTGLSRQSVINGIEEGMARGLIKRRPKGQGFLYRLKLVQNLDQSSLKSRPELVQNLDQSSLNFRPELVQNLDPQKKGKKDHDLPPPTNPPADQGGGGGFDRADPPTESEALLLDFHFQAATAYEFRDLPPDVVRAELDLARKAGSGPGSLVKRWRRVLPTLPKPAPPPNLPPAYYATPPPPRKRKPEEERHAATKP